MAYISTTYTPPQQEIATVIDQTAANAQKVMMWIVVIAIIVAVIMFGTKR